MMGLQFTVKCPLCAAPLTHQSSTVKVSTGSTAELLCDCCSHRWMVRVTIEGAGEAINEQRARERASEAMENHA